MSTEFLSTLRASGIELWVERGELRYRAPASVATEELLEAMRDRKASLIRALNPKPTATHHCGGGVFHQIAHGGEWLCSFCSPRVGAPVVVFVLAGGIIPGESNE